MRIGLLVLVVLSAMGSSAAAQEPYNLTAPVKNLATMFTDLFGPNGLIVDSEATLPGEQPHSAQVRSSAIAPGSGTGGSCTPVRAAKAD